MGLKIMSKKPPKPFCLFSVTDCIWCKFPEPIISEDKICLNIFLWQLYENVGRPDKKTWNHVSMCILNGGGIRSPIDEQSTNGT